MEELGLGERKSIARYVGGHRSHIRKYGESGRPADRNTRQRHCFAGFTSLATLLRWGAHVGGHRYLIHGRRHVARLSDRQAHAQGQQNPEQYNRKAMK